MQSTIECIHHGKPMLGLPFFYDQFGNMEYIPYSRVVVSGEEAI